MLRFVLGRLMMSAVVVLSLATLTFFVMHAVAGDPVRAVLGPHATHRAVAQVRHEYGFDRPVVSQYFSFLGDLMHGDLGKSLSLNTDVWSVVSRRAVPTLLLIAYGLAWALVLGVPLAVLAAVRRGGVVDSAVRFIATFAFGMPTFWLGLMLALLLGLRLGWFPVSGYATGAAGAVRTLTLPALTLGLSLLVIIVRTLRTNLIKVLETEYIEAARSRGLPERRIVGIHAMRNAIMPTLTILAVAVGYLIGGTVVIEAVFQIPGIGALLVKSVQQRDYQIVQALVLISGTVVVLMSLCTDVIQAIIDPRVRLRSQ
jgi:peptide/nickel transport system permease protein